MGPTRFWLGDLIGRLAALRYLVQGLENVGREDDHAARTPRCAAPFGRIAEHLHRSTGQRYFLQLPRRKKSNVLAIGRPEMLGWFREDMARASRSKRCLASVLSER